MLKVQVWSHTLDDFDPSVYVWEDDGPDCSDDDEHLWQYR